jgi:ABC-2 type transport system ATP-binding protein
MINVVGVTHHYGLRPVLRDVNLTIERGHVAALMGPNGMGKSTLLSVMGGVFTPYKGYVEIDGRRRRHSVDDELAIRRQCVYLPSDPWLPKLRTGRDFLMAVGRLYEIEFERLADHVERLLALFHLSSHGDTPIGSYSSGQKKKVALCAALVTEAPLMLLDEPFSGGLDASALLSLKMVLQRLAARDDVTAVVATPVPELVEEFAERIIVLKEGAVLAYDTAAGLRRTTGCRGRLEEVLERLIQPQTMEHIERYFEGRER